MSTTKLVTVNEYMTLIGEYDPVVAQEIADRTDDLLIKIMVAEANKQIEDYLALAPLWHSSKSPSTMKIRKPAIYRA